MVCFTHLQSSKSAHDSGIIHVVNAPVLPPLASFQTAFLLPEKFSILVSLWGLKLNMSSLSHLL